MSPKQPVAFNPGAARAAAVTGPALVAIDAGIDHPTPIEAAPSLPLLVGHGLPGAILRAGRRPALHAPPQGPAGLRAPALGRMSRPAATWMSRPAARWMSRPAAT